MNTTVQASFTLCANSFNHDMINKKLNIVPNYARYKDEILKNGRLFGHDEWGIETNFEESHDIDFQLSKITNILTGKESLIKSICEEYNAKCCFLIVIKVRNDTFPAMGITVRQMEFASKINAEIVITPYYL